MECEESVTTKQGVLATRARDWNESRANCLARLEVLSYSATARDPSASLASLTRVLFWQLASRKALLDCTLLSFPSHSLTHYPYIIPT